MISLVDSHGGKASTKTKKAPRSFLDELTKPVLSFSPTDRPFIEVITTPSRGAVCIVAPKALSKAQVEMVEDLAPSLEEFPAKAKKWGVFRVWFFIDWPFPDERPVANFSLYFGC